MEENWREFWKGVLAQLPVQLGVIPFGLVFGVLGIASGLTATQTILMSSIIFGGASQVVFAQLWSSGTSPIITGGSVAIINMRHIIYSANVSFYISSLPLKWRIILGYLLTDEAFAVSFQEFENKNKFAHYHLLGGGLTLWVFWQISTVIGVFLGANIPPLFKFRICNTFNFYCRYLTYTEVFSTDQYCSHSKHNCDFWPRSALRPLDNCCIYFRNVCWWTNQSEKI